MIVSKVEEVLLDYTTAEMQKATAKFVLQCLFLRVSLRESVGPQRTNSTVRVAQENHKKTLHQHVNNSQTTRKPTPAEY